MLLSSDQVLQSFRRIMSERNYKVMYSSIYQGFVTDPALMLLPLDEHMVHRGDGVFEALRFLNGKIYLVKPHLERLFRSSEAIALKVPKTIEEIEKICHELIELSGLTEGAIRIFVGRGPGDFSPNPYSTIGSQIYLIATPFKDLPEEKFQQGTSLMLSKVPVKPGIYSQVKSLNYLPNVMMKKESVDQNVDFSVALNEQGFIAEGPTENMSIVTKSGEFIAPKFDYTLRGTTLLRSMELLRKEPGLVSGVRTADLTRSDLEAAEEIMMIGTTLTALPVTQFDGKKVGSGKLGKVARRLRELILKDIETGGV